MRGEALYQPFGQPPYTVTAYTPVFYWLAALLQAAFGPGFAPGRVLSFGAGVVAAILVGQIAARRTQARWAGWFAGVLFFALGMPGAYSWLPLYKEDVLGVTLSLGAIAALGRGTGRRQVLAAATLAALAALTKQTFVAAGLAGAIWLWRRDRRGARLFASVAVALVVLVCAAMEATAGAFLANAIFANVNPFRPEVLGLNLGLLLLFQSGPIILAILYLLDRAGQTPKAENDLMVWYWALTMVPLVGLGKVGSNYNYWIEFAAATSILATLAVQRQLDRARMMGQHARMPVACLALAVQLVAGGLLAHVEGLIGPAAHSPSQGQLAEFASLVHRVRSEPGPVLANPLDVVTLAGKPVLFEPYLFSILQSEGQWDAADLSRQICAGEVRLLVLDTPLERGSTEFQGYTHWPRPVFDALRQTMRLEDTLANRFVYVPRGPLPPDGSAAGCQA
ncbi:MAG: glycosyltransferase family 39 protein [Chloroflexi bacterium]|nr:glycosyltransferase family 39 protein [Chloroflexota bacterium]